MKIFTWRKICTTLLILILPVLCHCSSEPPSKTLILHDHYKNNSGAKLMYDAWVADSLIKIFDPYFEPSASIDPIIKILREDPYYGDISERLLDDLRNDEEVTRAKESIALRERVTREANNMTPKQWREHSLILGESIAQVRDDYAELHRKDMSKYLEEGTGAARLLLLHRYFQIFSRVTESIRNYDKINQIHMNEPEKNYCTVSIDYIDSDTLKPCKAIYVYALNNKTWSLFSTERPTCSDIDDTSVKYLHDFNRILHEQLTDKNK